MSGNSFDIPNIILIIPRGEAVRNFLYSDTLAVLSAHARVTLLSIIDDARFLARFRPAAEKIVPLVSFHEHRALAYLRGVIQEAHFRWMWSKVAQNHWETKDARAVRPGERLKWTALKAAARLAANSPSLTALTRLENFLTWAMRPDDAYRRVFEAVKPDIVFNTSQIHGPAGDLPVKIAHRCGIPTACFIFSWDNPTSRSRITAPYDYFFVWNRHMCGQILSLYPQVHRSQVFVTGTPQFDFHFKPEFWLERRDLCRRIGADPDRPFILYTTGMDRDFPEEHRTVEYIARILHTIDVSPRPQLIVRTYVKGTSPQMNALAGRRLPGVIFPPQLWDEKWLYTPRYEDLAVYTSLLRECSAGINAASTVSLELMMHDKPVINLAFNPPGSTLPHHLRWRRHIEYDHYRPVAESGAVDVARFPEDLPGMIRRSILHPEAGREQREQFVRRMFADTLDGKSGIRVAQKLISVAGSAHGSSRHDDT
ncbi:MAG: hypothetical protein GF333_01625 [Candidatus Omnitrophica bacterium]|nr:hypothetical protein [Candidatus Omnitrophota bacterium]